VAITIDDLPAGAANSMSAAAITEMTAKLLTVLREQKVPAVGFVNERKLYKWSEVDERIGLKQFEDAVVQGEPVTTLLLAQRKMKLRYFRHPYLDTGRDLQTRLDVETFLTARGYRIAPVTLDAWDRMFAGVYDDARKRGDATGSRHLLSFVFGCGVRVFREILRRSPGL